MLKMNERKSDDEKGTRKNKNFKLDLTFCRRGIKALEDS